VSKHRPGRGWQKDRRNCIESSQFKMMIATGRALKAPPTRGGKLERKDRRIKKNQGGGGGGLST